MHRATDFGNKEGDYIFKPKSCALELGTIEDDDGTYHCISCLN